MKNIRFVYWTMDLPELSLVAGYMKAGSIPAKSMQKCGDYVFHQSDKIIVLDEATSALDSISERMIQQAIGNLIKDRTTFIVAHRLSTIRDADKIAVIAGGKCVEYGTYEELMERKGEFYHMKMIQNN